MVLWLKIPGVNPLLACQVPLGLAHERRPYLDKSDVSVNMVRSLVRSLDGYLHVERRDAHVRGRL